ncbi:MAG: hemolysin family protein [Planctomycetota bacterium]
MLKLLGDFGSWPYWLGDSLTVVGLLGAFLASLAASCFTTFSRARLDDLLNRLPAPARERLGARLARDLTDEDRKAYAAHALATLFTMLWAVGLLLPCCEYSCRLWGDATMASLEAGSFALTLAAGLLLAAGFTVLLPRVLALVAAERILIGYSRLFVVLILPTRLMARGAEWFDGIVGRLKGESVTTEIEDIHEEIGELLDEGQRGGHLKEDAGKMIDGVFRLHEKDVRAVMTPRTDMYCLPVEMPLEEAIQKANESGMSRLPVYENTRDSILGVFYAKDALKYLEHDRFKTMSLREIVREPFFIPETRQLDGLLEELQRNKVHIAIVLDEFGGTAGLITVEDIVEEVVGEIVDEYEAPETADTVRINDREIVAQGRTPILRINELLGVSLPLDEDYDTIAGYVLARLGRIPLVGERCEYEPLQIEILAANPRRIEKLRVTKLEPAADTAPARETEMAPAAK